MPYVGLNCLLKNTDLKKSIEKIIPILNVNLIIKNDSIPSFRRLYRELVKETGVDIDLDSFAEMYKSTIPSDIRITGDNEIDEILNAKTKDAFERLSDGTMDRLDRAGETSPVRAAINKAASILTVIEGKDNSKKTQTLSKAVKDAVLKSIQRIANNNERYKELKNRPAKMSFDETLQKVLELSALRTEQMSGDEFNTIQGVMEQARQEILKVMPDLVDKDGEPILTEEGLNFLEQYKNAVFGVMMSTTDANKIIRGALIEAGYGKGTGDNQVVDWSKIAGEINSPTVLMENVVSALQNGKGLTRESAESIAAALGTEFSDMVRGQKAMNMKYAIAEAEALDILSKLNHKPTESKLNEINTAIRNAIDQSVEGSDTINISDIVHDVLEKVGGIEPKFLSNIPKKTVIRTHSVDKIAKLIKGDGDIDSDRLAELYGLLGKVIDGDAISDLRRLTKLKEEIDAIEIRTDGDKLLNTRRGIEKAKAIQTISNEIGRIVAKSVDYSEASIFQKFLVGAMNTTSKFLSANTAFVLLNPFNLTQNIMSGAFAPVHGKIGGAIVDKFSKYNSSLTYTDPKTGKKINIADLLNTAGRFETWWNTTMGDEGRDIPDLLTGDPSKDAKTFQSAQTRGEKVEAALSVLPRAALTATDAMLKTPYFRQEVIRGVLYYLQEERGFSKSEAQDMVYKALTRNSVGRLKEQATQLATMVGKGNDKFYIKQAMEDIQLSSLVMLNEDGMSILSEDILQAIIDAATQTSGEAFGHRVQKDVLGFSWLFDIITTGRAKAVEGMNREYGEDMKDLYSKGDYVGAAWRHLGHTLKTTIGFLFQRGIYNWAVLIAQKNPISIIRGFRALSREVNLRNPKGAQYAVENYLRSRAKIGRGVLGTASAMAIVPIVFAALNNGCDGDEDCIKDKLTDLKKDPVWGRIYRNFVSPVAQTYIDARLSDTIAEGVGSGLGNMLITPVISSGARYYSADNVILTVVENLKKAKVTTAGKNIGGILTPFVPIKGFLSTNTAWFNRLTGEDSPGMIDKNFEIIIDTSKKPKDEDFWDSFWY